MKFKVFLKCWGCFNNDTSVLIFFKMIGGVLNYCKAISVFSLLYGGVSSIVVSAIVMTEHSPDDGGWFRKDTKAA